MKSIDNAIIAEWLALESEKVEGQLNRASRRASRSAFLWPEEAQGLAQAGRSLTEFHGVGPFIEKLIMGWLHNPPPKPRVPPVRRHFLTLAKARHVIESSDIAQIKGDLQMHSEWSDGSGAIAQMAEEALRRRYECIAITDHSKGLKIAGGIDEADLRAQGQEIKKVNEELGSRPLRVLRSIELNLSPSGAGDMDSTFLNQLDLVVGSFHSRLRVQEDQTERYIAALNNPDIQILGHPRGRVYNFRLGLTADWPRVFAYAAKAGKAVELDCYPDRQDLDIALLKVARDHGVYLAIDTDAHHPEQLAFMELGLAAAAQARFPRERIINCFSRDKLLEWVSELRKGARPRHKRRPGQAGTVAGSRRNRLVVASK